MEGEKNKQSINLLRGMANLASIKKKNGSKHDLLQEAPFKMLLSVTSVATLIAVSNPAKDLHLRYYVAALCSI